MPLSRYIHKICYGIGMAFSASCFAALGLLVSQAGHWSLLTLAASTAFMAIVILAISEMSASFPSAVGLRTYTRAGLGERASLAAVTLYLSLIVVVAGIEMRVFSAILDNLHLGLPTLPLAALVFGLVVASHMTGWRTSQWVQTGSVAALLVGVLVLTAPHLAAPPTASAAVASGALNLPTAAIVGVFLFASVEWITTLEVRGPAEARAIPRMLIVACAVLWLLFSLLAYALMNLQEAGMPMDPATPQLALGRVLGPTWSGPVVVAVTALALVSTCHAGLTCGARLLYLLARDGYTPRLLARSNSRGIATPAVIVVTLACLVGVAIVSAASSIETATEAAAVAVASVYTLYLVSAARLRRSGRRPAWAAVRLPLPVLWCAAAMLAGLALATCASAAMHGSLLWALSPMLVTALALAVAIPFKSRSAQAQAQARAKLPVNSIS